MNGNEKLTETLNGVMLARASQPSDTGGRPAVKGQFIRAVLGENHDANLGEVNRRWAALGHTGGISKKYFKWVRNRFLAAPASPAVVVPETDAERLADVVRKMEDGIDRVIYTTLVVEGFKDVGDHLRAARRALLRHQIEWGVS